MRVEESITIRARPHRVWEFVNDPDRYTEWMTALTRFQRKRGQGEVGEGSRYTMRIRAGSVEVGGVVEIVEYDPQKDIAWHSVSGLDQRGRLRLREYDSGCTTVTFRVGYQSPGGVWGLIAERVSGREVRRDMRASLEALRGRCEESGGDGAPGMDPWSFVRNRVDAVRVLAGAGVLAPSRPDRLLGTGLALRRWGLTVPGGYVAAAARYPDTVAVVDEQHEYTYAELDRRTNAIANGLAARGIGEGDRVALMCRNHAGFVDGLVALTKLGADVLLLNTGFAAPQLRDVLKREKAEAIIHDAEFSRVLRGAIAERRRFVAWTDSGRSTATTLDSLAAKHDESEPAPPERASRLTVLTSGTTGTPKGASRGQPRGVDPIVGIISRIPLRARETTLVAAPLFHAWGLAHLGLAEVLASTVLLQRKFDPEQTLAAIERHQASALIAIPVMLRRILDLPERVRSRYDTSSLRVVAVSGSALQVELAAAFMDAFGDVLYNLYGSTEVAAAAIATPDDMRNAPGTVGKPPQGTLLKLLDDQGRAVRRGTPGRIFVGSDQLFEGYTNGEGGTVVDGLLATGDVGRFDAEGRLFIEGRSDDMIVSGGENVFPAEVEELLVAHPAVKDVAVVGVADEEWGARLRAYIVRRGSSRLTEDGVKQHVRSKLARYKVPRDVMFIAEIPRSTTGKVVKGELPAD